MKIHGKIIKGPQEAILVIPRTRIEKNETVTEDYVFIAKAVLDYTELEVILPVPKPGFILKAGSETSEPNFKHPDYIKALTEWQEKKFDWMILKSLESSPGLEWEKVNMRDPKTWNLYKSELKEAGFNEMEIVSIHNLAARVNTLDEDRVEEARKRFLASREEITAK